MRIRLNGPALMEQATKAGHVTQEEIADHAGIGRTSLSRLIQGISTPKVDTLVALRNAYGFPNLDTLLLGADRPTVPAQAGATV